ncbi:MAG: hypothetical protein E7165_01835 [Firmicutes bacterium]|nr:hypothetical protein [Bacillota bacterium]
MGFLDKVKNLFTEEVEEAPIKKDVIQVEIPAPVSTENKEETISESEVLVKEEKPQVPIFFDDNDFASLERREKKEEKKVPKLEERYKGKEEEKKAFRPTPIISPVYGVLDKNYHKEDITPKKKQPTTSYYDNKSSVSIDDVRKKAFGTLEDELETVIPSDDYEIFEEKNETLEIDVHDGMLEDLMDPDYEPRFASKEIEKEEVTIKEDEDLFEEMHQELEESDNTLTESDLFNLIDSMYDKKEDE